MKKEAYCVDISYYDKEIDKYITYETTEYFDNLEDAKENYEGLELEDNECKELIGFIIDENGDFDCFETIEFKEKRTI